MTDTLSADAAALLVIIETEVGTNLIDRPTLVRLLHVAVQRMYHRCLEDCVLELHAKGKITLVD